MSTVAVHRDPAQNRYVARLTQDGVEQDVGVVGYERDGETWVLTHTVVPPEHEGTGIGSALARGVLDDLRAEGAPVRVLCPFLTAYIKRHPEYADMVELAVER